MNTERADAAAGKFGVKAYYSTRELFEGEELDSVSVCSAGRENGGDHYTPVIDSLNASSSINWRRPALFADSYSALTGE